jgi:serine protease AprX
MTALAQAQADAPPRALSQLLADATNNPEQTYRVIVERASNDQTADDYVTANGDTKLGEAGHGGFVANVKGKHVADLSRHPAVKHVTYDAKMSPMSSTPSCPTSVATGAPLTNQNLSGCNFAGMNLTKVNFSNSNLTGANFSGATLTQANISNSNLTGANLSNVLATSVNLSNSNASVANFSGANLTSANTGGLACSGAILTGVIPSGLSCAGGPAVVSSSSLATIYPGATQATSDWSSTITGAGVSVAVVDTGIASLGDFNTASNSNVSRIVASQYFSSATTNTNDNYGHGTHVAGTIAGNSWDGKNSPGQYVGIAPQATLVNVKVSDDQGNAYLSDIINGIEWAISNRVTYNIRVINLSLQSTVAESYLTDPLDGAVELAWFNGIAVVVAAGNSGANSELYSPANDPFVITVGAVDPLGTTSTSDDQIVSWSSYGTTQDGFAKPDIAVAGRYITATLASPTCVLAKTYPAQVVSKNYLTLSGTSMAAAAMSGIAALAFQAHPTWTNDQLKWALTQAANVTVLGGATPYPGQGAGEVNAKALVNYSATPGYANQGLGISTLLAGPNGAMTYTNTMAVPTSSSWSSSSWTSSSWTSSSWTSSSWTSSSWTTNGEL